MSLGLPYVSSTMTMSVCRVVSLPLGLSTSLGMMVKEAVSVCEGSPTLGGGGVRIAGPVDPRTCIRKLSSSQMATEISLCMLVVSTGIIEGGGVPTGVGWVARW